jgi:hypothetical protein
MQGSVVGEIKRLSGKGGLVVVVLRREIGDVLRENRHRQGRTLREVSDRIAIAEGVTVPDTIPSEISEQVASDLVGVA